MMFASKPPVQRRIECRGCIDSNGGRDWHDEVQHNEPNPILEDFRAHREGPSFSTWARVQRTFLRAVEYGQFVDRNWQRYDVDECADIIDHARRVLERLARS